VRIPADLKFTLDYCWEVFWFFKNFLL
jgi:hypothetical protein